ncbi:MAG: nagB, partial [Verrucomicrobia bacterium]|nr:nagB [Verrucomicrobiota bacterium]
MEVIIRKDAETGCLLGAKIIARLVREKPTSVLGLATGRTPLRLYQELIRMHRDEGLDFSRITTFNLDEYVGLPETNDQSYHYFMRENFFRHINIDLRRTHVPNGIAADLHDECRDYEKRIIEAGGIDLQLLGLGRNGHIGFNEPSGSLRSRTWIKILSEQTLEDNSDVFGPRGGMPRYAITMGIGTILDARRCLLLAFGPPKTRAVERMIEGPLAA